MAIAPAATISVDRCTDPDLAASIFTRDYFDDPIRGFPPVLARAFARWTLRGDGVSLLVAGAAGRYAGFIFGRIVGVPMWRNFLLARPWHGPALAWVRLKQGRGSSGGLRRTAPPVPAELAELSLPQSDRAFATTPGAGFACLLYTAPEARGRGVATALVHGFEAEFAARGCRILEAHIQPDNLASVRTFLKAGWSVERMAAGDFLARKKVAG